MIGEGDVIAILTRALGLTVRGVHLRGRDVHDRQKEQPEEEAGMIATLLARVHDQTREALHQDVRVLRVAGDDTPHHPRAHQAIHVHHRAATAAAVTLPSRGHGPDPRLDDEWLEVHPLVEACQDHCRRRDVVVVVVGD